MISGKLFEYMATGNPVLMVGDTEGEAAKLLSKQSYNLTVKPIKTDLIMSFIKHNYDNWLNGKKVKGEFDLIKSFSRKENTKKLINIIDNL